MKMWNRRDFLKIATASGVSAYASVHGWTGTPHVRVGIAGWNSRSHRIVEALQAVPGLRVTAVAYVSTSSMSSMAGWGTAFSNHKPSVYPNVRSLLKESDIDVLFADALHPPYAELPVHLLLDHPGLDEIASLASHAKCVQILPPYEFSGLSRSSSASVGKWNHATIECHATFPSKPFQNRSELASWVYRQIGVAIDTTCELMDVDDVAQVFGTATPANSPHTAKFGWRFTTIESPTRMIDVSVVATHAGKRSTDATISLRRLGQSTKLHSVPRSPQFTRFLTSNLLEAISNNDPQLLLYSPSALMRSHKLVSRAVMGL